jgi:GxxExxY protein
MTINITIVSSLIAFFVKEKKGPGQVANMYHPDINDDKFVLVVNKTDKMTDEETSVITGIMQNTGAVEIEEKEIEEDEDDGHAILYSDDEVQPLSELAELEKISNTVLNSALKVHEELGPWLLENVYREALAYELSKEGLMVEKEVGIPVSYEDIQIDIAFRIDILVNKSVLVAIKLVDEYTNDHLEQTLKYMQLSDCKVGLLINFNKTSLKDGIKRFVM